MVSVSNYTYEPSLTRRVAVDKPEIEDAEVADIIAAKLRAMLEDIKWLHRQAAKSGRKQRAVVVPESILFSSYERHNFTDLVITSVPRNTRPQMNWLGFASGPGYNGAGEMKSFGKFWQTVRDLPAIGLDFELRELEQVVRKIRDLYPEKGQYGGRGWANYVAGYFNDTRSFCDVLFRLLKPGAAAMIVLGNSVIQGIAVKTDHFFGRIAELSGLEFEETILLRNKRTGTSIIQSSVRTDKAQMKTVLYETGIVLRKPSDKR